MHMPGEEEGLPFSEIFSLCRNPLPPIPCIVLGEGDHVAPMAAFQSVCLLASSVSLFSKLGPFPTATDSMLL